MELPSPFIFTLESLSRKRVLMKYYFCEFQAPTRTENCKWSHLFLVTDNFYNRAKIRVNFFNTYRRSMIIDRLLRDNDKWILSSMPIDRFVQNVCSILFIRLKVGHGRWSLVSKTASLEFNFFHQKFNHSYPLSGELKGMSKIVLRSRTRVL